MKELHPEAVIIHVAIMQDYHVYSECPSYESKCSHIESSIRGKFGLNNIETATIKANFIILERMDEKQLVSICFIFDFALS